MATVAMWMLIVTNLSNGNVTTQMMPSEKACVDVATSIILKSDSVTARCEELK